jgi:hypothetical protein
MLALGSAAGLALQAQQLAPLLVALARDGPALVRRGGRSRALDAAGRAPGPSDGRLAGGPTAPPAPPPLAQASGRPQGRALSSKGASPACSDCSSALKPVQLTSQVRVVRRRARGARPAGARGAAPLASAPRGASPRGPLLTPPRAVAPDPQQPKTLLNGLHWCSTCAVRERVGEISCARVVALH